MFANLLLLSQAARGTNAPTNQFVTISHDDFSLYLLYALIFGFILGFSCCMALVKRR